MSSYHDSGRRTFTAGEAIERYKLVKLDGANANQVVKTGAGEEPIGSVENAVANGDEVNVILINRAGTIPVVAAGAIAVNADVYPAADGEVSDTISGTKLGQLLGATGAADEVGELLVGERS